MSKGDALNGQEACADERKRLARDVHDALGGDLAAIKMALAVLGRRLPQDQGLQDQLAYVDKLVDGAIDSMHRVTDQCQVAANGTFQLFVAEQLAAFSRQSGIVCRQTLADAPLDMRAPAAHALSHMLRECLTNIAKHAQATQALVGLRITGDRLVLEIEDDGVGLAASRSSAKQGSGIRGMRERASEFGGDFSMREVAPHGTLVVIEIPLGNGLVEQR